MTIATVLITSACSNSGNTPATIAAKVNGESISLEQINSLIGRNGNVSPEQAKSAAPQVLEKLIEQEMLAQKAIEAKLDRETQTSLMISNARQQILAQAYLDKVMAAAAKSTPDEIKAFYDKNPALFAQRRIYRFEELGAAVSDDKVDAIRHAAQKARKIGEIASWFKTQNIQYNASESTKPAEQLPMELLPELSKMEDGQIAVIPRPGRIAILQLVQSQRAGLDLQQATPLIEQYFQNGRKIELAKTEVKKLRDAAKIEYLGDFEKSKPAAADKGQPATK